MKTVHRKRTFSLGMVMATLLFGSAIAKADPVLDWNAIAIDTLLASGQNPFAQARDAAIVQLAVFEAVNAIKGDYQPYLGSIVAPHGASADAAAIQAAYRVLSTYFPSSASTIRQARQRLHDIAGAPDHPIVSAIGASVGMPVPNMTIASSGLPSRERSAFIAADPSRL